MIKPDYSIQRANSTPPALERDLRRTTTVAVVILFVVLALALVAVFVGIRAGGNLWRAEIAEIEVRERLWNSFLSKANGLRHPSTMQHPRWNSILKLL